MTKRKRTLGLALLAVLVAAAGAGWLTVSWAKTHDRVAPRFALRKLAEDPSGSGDASLSPDGKRFITSLKRGGQWDLWTFEIASGEWTRLTDHPADDFEARYSPDGQRVVFTSRRAGQKDLWLLHLQTKALQRLTTSEEDDEYPAFSADGKSVVYTGGPWTARQFFIVDVDLEGDGQNEPRAVNAPIPFGGACTFAPDGASLFCHTYDQGSGRLQRRWLADGQVTPLTDGADWDYKPVASPSGEWVAFSRSQEGPGDLWLLSLETGRTRPLVISPYEDRWPQYDATGERLFFHRMADRGTGVRLLDRQTGRVETLVDASEEPLGASFSPDGQRVVYCAQTPERKVLRIVELSGGARRDIDTGPGDACYPDWSPDGEWIAYASRRALGERWEISIARPDGSARAVLTAGSPALRGLDGPIDFSPDGQRLVFHGDTDPFAADLYTVRLADRQVEKLVDDLWFDEAPAFTPDGRGVVFMSTRGGDWTWGFYRLNLGDGQVESLDTPDYTQRNFPRQTPDGTLVWSVYDESGFEVLAERGPDGAVRLWRQSGPGARWPSLSPDGRLVLFTTVERRVEYWLIDHPLGEGSPALEPPRPVDRVAQTAAGFRDASASRSPVDLFHR